MWRAVGHKGLAAWATGQQAHRGSLLLQLQEAPHKATPWASPSRFRLSCSLSSSRAEPGGLLSPEGAGAENKEAIDEPPPLLTAAEGHGRGSRLPEGAGVPETHSRLATQVDALRRSSQRPSPLPSEWPGGVSSRASSGNQTPSRPHSAHTRGILCRCYPVKEAEK